MPGHFGTRHVSARLAGRTGLRAPTNLKGRFRMNVKKLAAHAGIMVVVALLCGASVAALAQSGTATERRVRFERGRKTVTLKGAIAPGHTDVYKVAANTGQKMKLHLASPNLAVTFILMTPAGEVLEGAFSARDWSGELPQKGDYAVTLVNNEEGGDESPYTLEVTVR
jgi:hypothetical protein